MNNVIGRSYVKTGLRSLEPTADDIFDKIINIKFIRRNGEYFTLRSDYEAVHHAGADGGTVSFKKCVQKPDIKVSYKQVSNTVAISVDIEIVDFYMGKDPWMYADDKNPVVWCTIQMGYRSQFVDYTDNDHKNNVSQFYDLDNLGLSSAKEVRRGNQIQVNILDAYQKGYPPDAVTYFHGIVGTREEGLRLNHTEANLIKGYGDPNVHLAWSVLEDIFYEYVTRRFVRSDITHVVEYIEQHTNEEAIDEDTPKVFQHVIKIYELQRLRAEAKGETFEGYSPETKNKDKWEEVPVDNIGRMSVEDADLFGVVCNVSKTLRKVTKEAVSGLYTYRMAHSPVDTKIPIPSGDFNKLDMTLPGQISQIQGHFGFLRWFQMMDGNYFFYHDKDKEADLVNDPYVKKQKKDNLVFLPAIYEMTPTGTRTIKCPFISFLNPMMTVIFESRYMMGSLVSFFYPVRTNAFLVISSQVEFATVQDNNVMELTCVDQGYHKVEYDPETGLPLGYNEFDDDEEERDRQKEAEELSDLQKKRNAWWKEKIVVTEEYTPVSTRYNNWMDFSEEFLKRADCVAWSEAGRVPTLKDCIQILIEDNQDLHNQNFDNGNSKENYSGKLGDITGIKVSWLHVGEHVYLRSVLSPSYDDMTEINPPEGTA